VSDDELFEAFSTYQRARAFSEATVRRRRLSLGVFARYMSPRSVTDASDTDVIEWLSGFGTASTRHAYRSDLRAFFMWGVRRSLVPRDPMVLVDSVRVPKRAPKPAPPEAITRAFIVADVDLQVMILLGALAGLRCAEIAALQSSDIHLTAAPPVIHVRNGKGGKDRVVPVHPMLQVVLERRACWLYRPHRPRLSSECVGRRLASALSVDGQRITAHMLRHYFGTEAARWSGGNVVLVQQLLGHSEPNTTMGYIGWAPSEGAEVVSKITAGGLIDELADRRALHAVV
jgi:integrase